MPSGRDLPFSLTKNCPWKRLQSHVTSILDLWPSILSVAWIPFWDTGLTAFLKHPQLAVVNNQSEQVLFHCWAKLCASLLSLLYSVSRCLAEPYPKLSSLSLSSLLSFFLSFFSSFFPSFFLSFKSFLVHSLMLLGSHLNSVYLCLGSLTCFFCKHQLLKGISFLSCLAIYMCWNEDTLTKEKWREMFSQRCHLRLNKTLNHNLLVAGRINKTDHYLLLSGLLLLEIWSWARWFLAWPPWLSQTPHLPDSFI